MVLTETGLAKVFQRVKSFVAAQLNSKASVLHTHTSSDITDLPNGYVVDSTLDGTSSNAISNSAVSNALDGLTSAGLLPIGSYIQFAGSQAPDGFLVCNGGAISRTTYSALFAVIGTTYGSGDGSTTFNLPDARDRFIEGASTHAVGTYLEAGLPNITGSLYCDDPGVNRFYMEGTGALYNATTWNVKGNVPSSEVMIGNSVVGFNASRSSAIYGNSTTVQPPALTCLICIKY